MEELQAVDRIAPDASPDLSALERSQDQKEQLARINRENAETSASVFLKELVRHPDLTRGSELEKLLREQPLVLAALCGVIPRAEVRAGALSSDPNAAALALVELKFLAGWVDIAYGSNLDLVRNGSEWVLLAVDDYYQKSGSSSYIPDSEKTQEKETARRKRADGMIEERKDEIAHCSALFAGQRQAVQLGTPATPQTLTILACCRKDEDLAPVRETLTSWFENLAKFGHAQTAIRVADDSPVRLGGEVRRMLDDLSRQHAIAVEYIGRAEKDCLNAGLLDWIVSSDRFQSGAAALGIGSEGVREAIKVCFGGELPAVRGLPGSEPIHSSGPTQNRNVAGLTSGRGAALVFDEDHQPFNLCNFPYAGEVYSACALEGRDAPRRRGERIRIEVDVLGHAARKASNHPFGMPYCCHGDMHIGSVIRHQVPDEPKASAFSREYIRVSGLKDWRTSSGRDGWDLKIADKRNSGGMGSSTNAALYLPPRGESEAPFPRFTAPVRNGDILIGQLSEKLLKKAEIEKPRWGDHRLAIYHRDEAGVSRSSVVKLSYDDRVSSMVERFANKFVDSNPDTQAAARAILQFVSGEDADAELEKVFHEGICTGRDVTRSPEQSIGRQIEWLHEIIDALKLVAVQLSNHKETERVVEGMRSWYFGPPIGERKSYIRDGDDELEKTRRACIPEGGAADPELVRAARRDVLETVRSLIKQVRALERESGMIDEWRERLVDLEVSEVPESSPERVSLQGEVASVEAAFGVESGQDVRSVTRRQAIERAKQALRSFAICLYFSREIESFTPGRAAVPLQ